METAEDIDIDRYREVADATEHHQFTAMENKPKKKELLHTPIGEAKWVHVHKAKEPFEGRGARKYQIDVVFDPEDPQWKDWAARIMGIVRALPEQIDKKTDRVLEKQIPIKKEFDQDDHHTGRFFVTFKTGEDFKPGVFDRYGKPIPETMLVGNGSKVRVAYTENTYGAFGGGMNFYLSAVQVVDLVEYGNRSAEAYGFPVEPYTEEEARPIDDLPF